VECFRGENLREVALREGRRCSMALRAQAWATAAAAASASLLCGAVAPGNSTRSVPHGRGRPQARQNRTLDWRWPVRPLVEQLGGGADPSPAGALPMVRPSWKRPLAAHPAGRPDRVAEQAGTAEQQSATTDEEARRAWPVIRSVTPSTDGNQRSRFPWQPAGSFWCRPVFSDHPLASSQRRNRGLKLSCFPFGSPQHTGPGRGSPDVIVSTDCRAAGRWSTRLLAYERNAGLGGDHQEDSR